MKYIKLEVTKKMYDALIDRFGSQKRVEDLISLKIESSIKNALMNQKAKEYVPREEINIFLRDEIYQYLNDICVKRSISKKDFIRKKLSSLLE